MYESLQNNNYRQFDDIYFGVKDGSIATDVRNIASICELSVANFDNSIEPHQLRKMVKMTCYICDRHDLEEGIVELIKGIKKIYNKSLSDQEKKIKVAFFI